MTDIFELFETIFSPDTVLPEVTTIRRMVNVHASLMTRADQKRRQVDAILKEEHAWVFPKGEDSSGAVEVPRVLIEQYMTDERQNLIAQWRAAYEAICAMSRIADDFFKVYDNA